MYQEWDGEDQILNCCLLTHLAIDLSFYGKDFWQFAGWHSNWTYWAVSVWRFANVELLVISLALASSHVVDNGVTPDIVNGICLRDPEPGFANDDTNFTLIIRALGEPLMRENWFTRCDDTCCTFGEEDRMCWLVHLVTGIKSGRVELYGMLPVSSVSELFN